MTSLKRCSATPMTALQQQCSGARLMVTSCTGAHCYLPKSACMHTFHVIIACIQSKQLTLDFIAGRANLLFDVFGNKPAQLSYIRWVHSYSNFFRKCSIYSFFFRRFDASSLTVFSDGHLAKNRPPSVVCAQCVMLLSGNN